MWSYLLVWRQNEGLCRLLVWSCLLVWRQNEGLCRLLVWSCPTYARGERELIVELDCFFRVPLGSGA